MADFSHNYGFDIDLAASGDLLIVTDETQQHVIKRLLTAAGDMLGKLFEPLLYVQLAEAEMHWKNPVPEPWSQLGQQAFANDLTLLTGGGKDIVKAIGDQTKQVVAAIKGEQGPPIPGKMAVEDEIADIKRKVSRLSDIFQMQLQKMPAPLAAQGAAAAGEVREHLAVFTSVVGNA